MENQRVFLCESKNNSDANSGKNRREYWECSNEKSGSKHFHENIEDIWIRILEKFLWESEENFDEHPERILMDILRAFW